MNTQKKSGRFSYLAGAPEQQTENPAERENATGQDGSRDRRSPKPGNEGRLGSNGAARSGVEESGEQPSGARKRSSTPRHGRNSGLQSVPKGEGRMKQDRSQLNVRIPTTLKRQASAKAVLEGREMGEVVEELLREYLSS